ncbi:hypothetical protein NO135_25400, partial [Clostridioides difficile]|nr:hypothetical protein [Clostridioides difficile]
MSESSIGASPFRKARRCTSGAEYEGRQPLLMHDDALGTRVCFAGRPVPEALRHTASHHGIVLKR